MLSEEELKAIEARAEKATPGPWRVGYPGFRCTIAHRHGEGGCRYTFDGWRESDHQIHVDQELGPDDESDDERQVAGTWDYEYGGIAKRLDAEFIADARQSVPALIAELRRERAEVERLTNERRTLEAFVTQKASTYHELTQRDGASISSIYADSMSLRALAAVRDFMSEQGQSIESKVTE